MGPFFFHFFFFFIFLLHFFKIYLFIYYYYYFLLSFFVGQKGGRRKGGARREDGKGKSEKSEKKRSRQPNILTFQHSTIPTFQSFKTRALETRCSASGAKKGRAIIRGKGKGKKRRESGGAGVAFRLFCEVLGLGLGFGLQYTVHVEFGAKAWSVERGLDVLTFLSSFSSCSLFFFFIPSGLTGRSSSSSVFVFRFAQ